MGRRKEACVHELMNEIMGARMAMMDRWTVDATQMGGSLPDGGADEWVNCSMDRWTGWRMGLNSWTEGSVTECGVTLASCLCAAAHCGILRRVPVLPGADRPLQAGQGGLPVLRPHAVHALRGHQRGTHPAAHAAQPGLCRPCGLGESQRPGAWDSPAPHPLGLG